MVDQPRESVEVPYGELAPDVLRAVVESFVLREGTDYGEREFSLHEKVARVIDQLKHGDARVIFDPQTQSVSIVTVRAVRRLRSPHCR
jgi:uncharacterized protein YheU (UPF0270 family)